MSNEGEAMGQATVALFQIIFSLFFPVIVISTCAASYVLSFGFNIPQFGLWAGLAGMAVAYAKTTPWAALALIAFVVAALPLAWVGFREHATRVSSTIGGWVTAAIFSGGTLWLAAAWPADYSNMQAVVFAFLLFASCTAIFEALLDTSKLIAQNRPQPGPEVVVAQKAHGDAQLAGEAEALSLLKSRK
jgi:hypothetical protein